MKSNILLVGLDYDFVKNVALELSGLFDMHFLDVKDLISYNLIDEQNVLDKAGIEYYNTQVHKIVLSTKDYENTIINIPYDLFLKDEIANELKKSCLTIFLNISEKMLNQLDDQKLETEKNPVAIIACDELSLLLQQQASYKITCENGNLKLIMQKITELLKNINLSELK